MKSKSKTGLVIYIITVVVIVLFLFLEIKVGLNSIHSTGLSYSEKGDISYKVYLKDNDYYDTPYLDENSSYIASLIDNFNLNYNYVSTFSDDVEYTLKYGVTANLIVYDSDNAGKPIYTKKYVIVKDKEVNGKGKLAKLDLINQVVKYDEYNRIVQSLKKEIIPNANLVINFNTELTGKNDKVEKNVVSHHTSTLSIPISQRTINIDLAKDNFNETKTVRDDKKLSTGLIIIICSTMLALIVVVVCLVVYVIKNTKRQSKYEHRIKKILREYDRAITEAKSQLVIPDDANTIEVKGFEELLDVHDNLNVPIVYYKTSNVKSVFLVKNDIDIYYYVIKKDDFD